jgi:voltage-gated potassium channel Kch
VVSFLVTLLRLVRAFRHAIHDPEFRALAIVLSLLLASGTVFYTTVEGWPYVDALYFSLATISTVGYGDFTPRTQFGKAFTMIYIVVGVGAFVALAGKLAGTMMRGAGRRETRR